MQSTPAMSTAPAASSATAAQSSGSKRSFPGAAADPDRRVQPRHFHAGPNPAAAPSASSDAVAMTADPSPASRLYRHALESIFGWLNQHELAVALQVSKSWLAAVESMASLQLTLEEPSAPLRVVARSALGRHVTQLGSESERVRLTADALFILAHHTEQLRELNCELQLTPSEGPLTFPPALQTLDLRVTGAPTAADVNAAMTALSPLRLLTSLAVHLPSISNQLSFAPLASLPKLRDLTIDQPDDNPELSDAQVDELRAMPLLRRLEVMPMSTSLLRRLLAQPHALQWQDIGLSYPFSDEVAALLPQLPSLTLLAAGRVTATRFDFLQRLPNLIHFGQNVSNLCGANRIESLLAGLQCCSQLTALGLYSTEITAAHLADLLPRLTQLRTLELSQFDIDSLSFLAQPPMTRQLTVLALYSCKKLPVAELRHVLALKGLKYLHLHRSFSSPLDDHSRWLLTPPSLTLPQLEKFEYSAP